VYGVYDDKDEKTQKEKREVPRCSRRMDGRMERGGVGGLENDMMGLHVLRRLLVLSATVGR